MSLRSFDLWTAQNFWKDALVNRDINEIWQKIKKPSLVLQVLDEFISPWIFTNLLRERNLDTLNTLRFLHTHESYIKYQDKATVIIKITIGYSFRDRKNDQVVCCNWTMVSNEEQSTLIPYSNKMLIKFSYQRVKRGSFTVKTPEQSAITVKPMYKFKEINFKPSAQ